MNWLSSQEFINDKPTDYIEFISNANNEFPCEKSIVYSLIHKTKGTESVVLSGLQNILNGRFFYVGQIEAFIVMYDKLKNGKK